MTRAIEFALVCEHAKEEFATIDKDIPGLKKKAYLVISSPFGQCDLTDDTQTLFREFPKAFARDEAFQRAKALYDQVKELTDAQKPTEVLAEKLARSLDNLKIAEDVKIEIRWKPGSLDYSFMARVMEHPSIHKNNPKSPFAPVVFIVD
jgi:hypothetical protein